MRATTPQDTVVPLRAFDARGRRLVEQRLRLDAELERIELEFAAETERLSQENRELSEENRELSEEHGKLRREYGKLKEEYDRLDRELQNIRASRSIRYTAAFRGLLDPLRRLRK